MENKTIKICDCHEEQVPLIWTFAFPGAEYWCPACGYCAGMFGAGRDVDITDELTKAKEEWKKKSEAYLEARSVFSCSEMEYEGKRIKPADLPDEVKDRYRKVIKDHVYEITD